MRLRLLKLILQVGGVLLLVVGVFKQAVAAFGSLREVHSDNSASLTLMVPLTWLYVAAVGFALLVGSFFIPRRREDEDGA
jgi:hypothetical protein